MSNAKETLDGMKSRTNPEAASRLAPSIPFPPYAYVPGRDPHPTRNPIGHRFLSNPAHPLALDANDWRSSSFYLYGVDLFNFGYYWEAHEMWEALWRTCGRSGRIALFLQGLIRLAAAGVSVRRQNARGLRIHARRAMELFMKASLEFEIVDTHCMGLNLTELADFARNIASRTRNENVPLDKPIVVVFDFILQPH